MGDLSVSTVKNTKEATTKMAIFALRGERGNSVVYFDQKRVLLMLFVD